MASWIHSWTLTSSARAAAFTSLWSDCGFDVALFEAIGTWVGGVGAIAVAVVGGVYARRRHREAALREQAREREAALRSQAEEREAALHEQAREREAALLAASTCSLRYKLKGNDMGGYQKLDIILTNNSSENLEWPIIRFDGATEVATMKYLYPGKRWSHSLSLEHIGTSQDRKTRTGATKLVEEAVVKRGLHAEFTVRNVRLRRTLKELSIVSPMGGSHRPDGVWVAGPVPTEE